MLETTISKSTQMAENLAASVIINQLIKEARHAGSLDLHLKRRELLGNVVMATMKPIEE